MPIWTVFVTGYVMFACIIYFGEYELATRVRKVPARRAKTTALRFAFGVWSSTMIAVMIVEYGKNYVGRLRPNFGHRCLGADMFPILDAGQLARVVSGDDGCRVEGGGGGGGGDLVWDGRRSFPSGHAALSCGIGVYAFLWSLRASDALDAHCHTMATACGSAYVPYFAGIGALMYGFYVAASRVVDNAHHVSDVVGGACIGVLTATAHFSRVERATRRAEALAAARDA